MTPEEPASALLARIRRLASVEGVDGVPSTYRAKPMPPPKGTRGGGSTLTGLRVGEEGWPPDVHVHVRSIPTWLVWTMVGFGFALVGVGVWIGLEVHRCADWSMRLAQENAQLGGK